MTKALNSKTRRKDGRFVSASANLTGPAEVAGDEDRGLTSRKPPDVASAPTSHGETANMTDEEKVVAIERPEADAGKPAHVPQISDGKVETAMPAAIQNGTGLRPTLVDMCMTSPDFRARVVARIAQKMGQRWASPRDEVRTTHRIETEYDREVMPMR